MSKPLADKQLEFIINSTKKWNLAHGPVSCGKTVGTLFRALEACFNWPDSQIYFFGHSSSTLYENVVKLIFETPQFELFRPFCSLRKNELRFRDKSITLIGCKDEGSIGRIQGKTISLAYCDEMTLYPENIIHMIDTRLRLPHSIGIASMNPKHPTHILKQWIDKAREGNTSYYELGFTMDDNPYLPDDYKKRIKESLSGLFYKRNYLGIWCLAEGAIFDFFDTDLHVIKKPPRAADYWIAGIDYGVSNAFGCVVIGVSTGIKDQTGKSLWVEDEYYWNSKKEGRQKTNSEYADDLQSFLEPYGIKSIYIDPSALSMKVELNKRGIHVTPADNDVLNGIETMTSEMCKGNLFIISKCKNIIREIENYVWDQKKSEEGEDRPIKKGDHLVDALRYCIMTHKVPTYNPYKQHQPTEYQQNRFQSRFR